MGGVGVFNTQLPMFIIVYTSNVNKLLQSLPVCEYYITLTTY